jgi:hypothetical protein
MLRDVFKRRTICSGRGESRKMDCTVAVPGNAFVGHMFRFTKSPSVRADDGSLFLVRSAN